MLFIHVNSVIWHQFFSTFLDINIVFLNSLNFVYLTKLAVRPDDKPRYDSKICIESQKHNTWEEKVTKLNASNSRKNYKQSRNNVNNLIKNAQKLDCFPTTAFHRVYVAIWTAFGTDIIMIYVFVYVFEHPHIKFVDHHKLVTSSLKSLTVPLLLRNNWWIVAI